MTSAEIRQSVIADLERRLQVLQDEVKEWKNATQVQGNGFGIHSSQLQALGDMMNELSGQQSAEFKTVKETQNSTQFADAYYNLLEHLSGAQDVWRIFGTILGQRQNERLKRLTDIADLVAWNCYATCIEEARRWQLFTEDEYREPPLTFLESSLSPSTASRGEQVQILGLSLRHYRNLMLPVPIVLYPLDQASSMWMMCSIAHEVGHNLDHDLDPRPGNRLSDEYRKLLIGRVSNSREPQWRRWMNEIFADAIAVILCGAGFAFTIAQWAVPLGPGTQFQALDAKAVHPPFYLRLLVIAEMLRFTGVEELKAEGDKSIELWKALKRPAWQMDYEEDAPILAKLVLEETVSPLKNHNLLDLRSSLTFDHNRSVQLAAHWIDANQPRPHPKTPAFPFRLVPAAAALAVAKLAQPDSKALDTLQEKAITFFNQIDQPAMLGSAPKKRREYLKGLARRLDFSIPRKQVEDD